MIALILRKIKIQRQINQSSVSYADSSFTKGAVKSFLLKVRGKHQKAFFRKEGGNAKHCRMIAPEGRLPCPKKRQKKTK